MQFSEWFKERFAASGMSAKELAEKSGLSKPIIYFYLSGQRMPTEANLSRLVGALGGQPLTTEETLSFTRKMGRPPKP